MKRGRVAQGLGVAFLASSIFSGINAFEAGGHAADADAQGRRQIADTYEHERDTEGGIAAAEVLIGGVLLAIGNRQRREGARLEALVKPLPLEAFRPPEAE